MNILVDADACPVKDEVLRVAERHGCKTYLVTDGGIRDAEECLAAGFPIYAAGPASPAWYSTSTRL